MNNGKEKNVGVAPLGDSQTKNNYNLFKMRKLHKQIFVGDCLTVKFKK